MLSSTKVQDGSGRVTVTTTDDRGEPEPIGLGQIANFIGLTTYQELITIPLNRDPQRKRGSARLGLFLFSANVNPGTVANDYLVLDCFVTGYLGGAGTVVKRMSFGPGAPNDFLRLDDSNNYDAIGVSGRQLLNGLPDNSAISALSLTVIGRISR